MSVAFDHRDPGTPEGDWRTDAIPAEPLTVGDGALIVVAAHPDDETLGAGGLLRTAARDGREVTVLIATDGEAADPTRPGAGIARRQETAAALAHLAPRAGIRFLGLPDGGLRERTEELDALLTDEFRRHDPADTTVAVTWWEDGHRDHRVLGEAVRRTASGMRVLGYPVWYWHWGDPDAPHAGPWVRLDLDDDARRAKRAAIGAYASQHDPDRGEPVLHAGMLAHFDRAHELFVDAGTARGAASVPQEWFERFFRERADPWGFDSRWYEERKRALVLAALPRRRYARGVELGCATGALTAALAERCDELVGVDASAEALGRARDRAPEVTFEQRVLPGDWPTGTWDLIVFSEVGYFLSAADMDEAARRMADALRPGGTLLACHWRHTDAKATLDADAVHRALARTGLRRRVHHVEDDVLLDVWTHPDTPSVAEAEGLA